MVEPLEIFDFEQGSPEWFEVRRGIPTASEFSAILAKGEGKTRRSYMLRLVGEVLTGECAEKFSNPHTERGQELEEDAVHAYSFIHDVEPESVGFMRRGRVGASPDRLIGENGLLEIKTKLPALQLDVLERNRLPPEHVAQVQGQLWVSGREFCDFVSYWPKLPLFVIRIERDEAYIKALAQSVSDFVGEMDVLTSRYRIAA